MGKSEVSSSFTSCSFAQSGTLKQPLVLLIFFIVTLGLLIQGQLITWLKSLMFFDPMFHALVTKKYMLLMDLWLLLVVKAMFQSLPSLFHLFYMSQICLVTYCPSVMLRERERKRRKTLILIHVKNMHLQLRDIYIYTRLGILTTIHVTYINKER